MQGRRIDAQPSGEMLESFARYIAGGRSMFALFCFSQISKLFVFRSLVFEESCHVNINIIARSRK